MINIDEYDLEKESYLTRLPKATHYLWPFAPQNDNNGWSTVAPDPVHRLEDYDSSNIQNKPSKNFTGDKITFYQVRVGSGMAMAQSYEDSVALTSPDDFLMVGTQVQVIDIITDHVTEIRYAKFVPVGGQLPESLSADSRPTNIQTFMHTAGPTGPAIRSSSGFHYYIDLRALRKFSSVDHVEYKSSISGYAPVPKQTYIYNLTTNANAENKNSFDGINSLADVKSAYCAIEEDLRTFGISQGTKDNGPIHDVDLYYVCRIKGVDTRDTFSSALNDYISRETDPALPLKINTEYFKRLIYKAKIRAVMYLLADFGKIIYDRDTLFSTFDFDSEQLTLDYFESLYHQGDFKNHNNLVVDSSISKKEVFGRAINSEAVVPKNMMNFKFTGQAQQQEFAVNYDINVFVRASFIHSFEDVDFDYNAYLENSGGFTISSQSFHGVKNFISSVQLLPEVLETFHDPIEAFKKQNVVMIDMKEEAKRAEAFLQVLDGFFQIRGQGGYKDGFSFGLQEAFGLPDDQFIEIGLSNKMYPIFANATEHTYEKPGAMRIVTSVRPVNCNIGLVRLGLAVKPRTFGYVLNLPKILRWIRSTGTKIGDEKGTQEKITRPGRRDRKALRKDKKASRSRRYNYRLVPDEVQKKAGKANWLDFVSSYTNPPVFIAADKDNIDAIKLERCLEKVKLSGAQTGNSGVFGPGYLDDECKRLIFIDRKKAKQYVGDKTFSEMSIKEMIDKLSLSSIGDTLKSEMKKELIHHEILNKIDLYSLIDNLISCIQRVLGVDLSAQALCEAALKALFGKEGFREILNILKDSREILGALETLAAQGAVTLDADSIPVEEPREVPSNLSPTQYAKTVEELIDEALAEAEDLTRAKSAEMFQSAGAAAQELRSAEAFLAKLKEMVDLRAVCAVLLGAGLAIPNLNMNLDFAMPKLPKIPEIPKFPKMPVIIKFDEYDFWKNAHKVMMDVLTSQLINFVNSLLSQLLEQCFQADSNMGAPSRPFPLDFGPLVSPPYEVFDNYGLPDNRDRIRDFLRRVFNTLNAKEGCALLRGAASNTVLQTVQDIVFLHFPEYAARLDTKSAIQDFFVSVGAFFNLDFCDLLGEVSTAVDDICNELDFYNQRMEDLMNQGLSEEEARNIIHAEIDKNIAKLSDLAGKQLRGPGGFFDGTAPKLDCSPGGVFPGIPPSLESAKNNVLDVVYDAVLSGYNIDIDTIHTSLTTMTSGQGKALAGAMSNASTKLFGSYPVDDEFHAVDRDDDGPVASVSRKIRRSQGGAIEGLGDQLIEPIIPFSKLYDILAEQILPLKSYEKAGYSVGLSVPMIDYRKVFQIYKHIEYNLTGENGEDASTVMKIPKIDLSDKQLLTEDLKGALSELTKVQEGVNVQSFEAIQNVVGQLNGEQTVNQFTSKLIDFMDGDLKLTYKKEKESELANRDLTRIVLADTALDMEEFSLRDIDKVVASARIEKTYTPEYLETLGDLGNQEGISFTNFDYRRVFAEFMAFSIENKLPKPFDEGVRTNIVDIFYYSYDKIIFDYFNEFNSRVLESPIFEKAGFDKAFAKIFPELDECISPLQLGRRDSLQSASNTPKKTQTLINFASLKEYADKRMADMLCKTYFDPSRLSNMGIKTIMSKAAMESLAATYIRIEVLKYIMAAMPMLPLYNLKETFKSDFFHRNIIEGMEYLEDEAPEFYKILLDNCYRIERYKLRAGGGETSHNAMHHHTYEIDENGNGFAYMAYPPTLPTADLGDASPNVLGHKHEIQNYKIVEAQTGCWPNCPDLYGTQGVGPHVHELEEKHNLLSRQEAFEKVVKEQIDAMLPIVNNYFSPQLLKFDNVKRVENHEDFFKSFVYPVYDPATTFTGPFNYGYERGANLYVQGSWEYQTIGNRYRYGTLLGYTQHNANVLGATGKGYFATDIGRRVTETGGLSSRADLIRQKRAPGLDVVPRSVAPYLGSMEQTFATNPGVVKNGSGLFNWTETERNKFIKYLAGSEIDPGVKKTRDDLIDYFDSSDNGQDIAVAAIPMVSTFGLFSIEPYMYVKQKEFYTYPSTLVGNYGWGIPAELEENIRNLVIGAGYAYALVNYQNLGNYFRDAVDSTIQGEQFFIGNAQVQSSAWTPGSFQDLESKIVPTRNESVLSRLMKYVTYDNFSEFDTNDGFFFEESDGTVNGAMAGVRSDAYQHRFDDEGVCNMDFWGMKFPKAVLRAEEQFRYFKFTPSIAGGNVGNLHWSGEAGISNAENFYNVKLNQVFDRFCFGMRMVFNVTDDKIIKRLRDVLTNHYTNLELETFMTENKLLAQAERKVTSGTSTVVADDYGDTLPHMRPPVLFERFTIELFDTKMPLQHGYKCLSKYKNLVEQGQIYQDEKMGGLKLQNIVSPTLCNALNKDVPSGAIATPLDVFREHVIPVFHDRLMDSNQFKLLFKHLFNYEEMLPAYLQYVITANKEVEPATIFRASQALVENFLVNMTRGEYLPEELADPNYHYRVRQRLAGLGADFDFGGMVAQLALQTPLIILQNLVENFDPAVSVSSSIQKYARQFATTLVGIAQMALAMAEQGKALAIQAAQLAIGDAQAAEAEAEAKINQIVEEAKFYDMIEETSTLYDPATQSNIETKTLVATSSSEGDYGGGEDDVTSATYDVEAVRQRLKQQYDDVQAKLAFAKNEVIAQQNAIQQADEDAQGAIDSAREALEVITKLSVVTQPGMLILFTLALVPNNLISSVSGFPLPFAGPLPMSPLGLVHILLEASGINANDIILAQLQRAIDDAAREANGEEKENCAEPTTETIEE